MKSETSSALGPVHHSRPIRLSSIAMPAEHGAWGFTLEPLLLALLVAFSPSGLYLAVGALTAFLAHQPLRVWLKNGPGLKQKTAMVFFLIYALPAALFLFWFILRERFISTLPLYITLALMIAYVFAEKAGQGRRLYVEIMAALSMAIISMSITLSADWTAEQATGLMLFSASRTVPSVFYVRARLRLDKNNASYVRISNIVNIMAFGLVFLLIYQQGLSWFVLLPFLVLLGRALYGVSSYRPRQTVKQIGIVEFLVGLQMVILVAVGYWMS